MKHEDRVLKCGCCTAGGGSAEHSPQEAAGEQAVSEAAVRVAGIGWTVMGVPGGSRSFIYTIGLTRLGIPELAFAGFPEDQMRPMYRRLAELAEGLCRSPRGLRAGDIIEVNSLRFRLRPTGVEPNMAYRLYGREAVSILELVE